MEVVHVRTQSAISVPATREKYAWSLAMPQPTINSWPFAVKELPSADGHMGAAVAGAGAAEVETVAGKLADAGTVNAGVRTEVSEDII